MAWKDDQPAGQSPDDIRERDCTNNRLGPLVGADEASISVTTLQGTAIRAAQNMADFRFSVSTGLKTKVMAPGQPAVPVPTHQDIELNNGEFLFVLGANGTGKSSLMLNFYSPHQKVARRIVSHRQNWFESGGLNMTAQQRTNTGSNIQSQDAGPHSRWKDDYAAQRASMAIYDLIDAENVRARGIARAADAKDLKEVQKLAAMQSPLSKINTLLKLSNLPIELSIEEGQKLNASRNGGQRYDVAELSDGERNALLIASNVLTAPAGTLFVIDEPERHLHRSIISSLLSLLFRQRTDCAFIVSTHDVMLAVDNPGGQKLLVRGCTHNTNKEVIAWDVDLVPAGGPIDDSLMQDILGARRKVIFVEGTSSSLDLPLYTAIFPTISVVPKNSCVDVTNAVNGVRGAANTHWVKAFGIVDGDGRPASELAALQQKGVYAVRAYSVESVYYHPEMQKRIAAAQVAVQGGDVGALVSAASTATITAVRSQMDRLAARIVEKDVREQIIKQIPGHQSLAASPIVSISFSTAPLIAAEKSRLATACSDVDLETIICRYPVRETAALGEIAKALKFQSSSDYEAAVRQLLLSDATAATFARGLFGSLYADVSV
jgi:ABC-type cobalamin/Fe3+-siderophores transport system ATPase subunit